LKIKFQVLGFFIPWEIKISVSGGDQRKNSTAEHAETAENKKERDSAIMEYSASSRLSAVYGYFFILGGIIFLSLYPWRMKTRE
jgi:hypothetical protein